MQPLSCLPAHPERGPCSCAQWRPFIETGDSDEVELDEPGRGSIYRQLLRQPSFKRFFIGQISSSLGDWVGLIAIVALVKRIYDDEFAIAAVLLARIGPTLLFSPIAGVLADRWDRKKTMVACDLARAGLILMLPFVEAVGRLLPILNPVVLLFVVSALLEMLTLAWQPAKDATVPDMVQNPKHFTHAYSLLLIAAYATFPLSGAIFGLLAKVSEFLGDTTGSAALGDNPELLAFLLDSATFLVSAALTLSLRIAPRPTKIEPLNLRATRQELVDGLRFLFAHEMIRPWVIGVGGTFAGIGTFMSMAPFFLSDVLGGGSGSFGLLVAAVGTGLGTGFLLAGPASQYFPKDIIFSSVVVAMGVSMVIFGSVSTLTTALLFASLSGVFAGFAYPCGYALIQEKLGPNLRGRGSAAINSVVRLAIVGASAVAPALVKLIDRASPGPVRVFDQSIDIRGIRVAMWIGGMLIVFAGIVTTKAIGARHQQRPAGRGMFLVFEGGDGSGKTTQMELLRQHLEARGHKVVVTCEPGGTEIGRKIRALLLDPANKALSDKAEALLYAADRAQHVDELIRPALHDGAIVICDRYIDSSIAYQGLVRGLGADQIRAISRWGTGGLFPDMVFLLDYEASLGLERAGGDPDRIEMEGVEFHRRVREAYRLLAERHANRFQIIDGSKSPQEVAAVVRRKVELMLAIREEQNPRIGAQAEANLTS
ncbi:MAG TPA: dTMP kinase [Actinomycetota bacterium]|nr:dTMP kinase [Actinomycetota bacterium]